MASLYQQTNPGLIRLIEVLKEMDEILSNQDVRNRYIEQNTCFFKDEFVNGESRIEHDKLSDLLQELNQLADEELVNEECSTPDPFALSIMRGQNYKVIPGEKDSFGWLSGIIIAKQFQYTFG